MTTAVCVQLLYQATAADAHLYNGCGGYAAACNPEQPRQNQTEDNQTGSAHRRLASAMQMPTIPLSRVV